MQRVGPRHVEDEDDAVGALPVLRHQVGEDVLAARVEEVELDVHVRVGLRQRLARELALRHLVVLGNFWPPVVSICTSAVLPTAGSPATTTFLRMHFTIIARTAERRVRERVGRERPFAHNSTPELEEWTHVAATRRLDHEAG